MPEQEQSTPPPEVHPRSPFEKECQSDLIRFAGQLSAVRARLVRMHVRIGEQAPDVDMAEGVIPESLGYSIRGAIECVCEDHLEPAIKTLETAARETHWDLVAQWCRRKGLPAPGPYPGDQEPGR